ncbi:hypothetical protein GOEFS_035_00510 [Gordonia effusa NBRC 100432]|uniref:Uncharacterized protein n=1 Tax=Gordonia effusa NBRC 100432 TaxID=1077974 RepID=H0QXG8_9ACTN|nr:hypothetical protein [Gordonia effusa]GAB17519.1 hypothetical protein GOEFS_035_00510 [Gordonia effusa NBRC 100432]
MLPAGLTTRLIPFTGLVATLTGLVARLLPAGLTTGLISLTGLVATLTRLIARLLPTGLTTRLVPAAWFVAGAGARLGTGIASPRFVIKRSTYPINDPLQAFLFFWTERTLFYVPLELIEFVAHPLIAFVKLVRT